MRERSIKISHEKKSGMVVESVDSPEMLTGEQQVDEEKDVNLSKEGKGIDFSMQVQNHEFMRQVHEPRS